MSEIIGASVEEVTEQQNQEQPEEQLRTLGVTMTFTQEGVKLDVRSNLTALEQLGAIEIFKAHLLASALGSDKQ
jgi:hypothetical protein